VRLLLCLPRLLALTAGVMVSGCSQPEAHINDTADSGLIVFSATDTNGYFQIYSVKPDGSNKTQLTSQGNNVTPSWVPDNQRIIFASDRSGTREIYLMNDDGSGVSQIETSVVGNKLAPSMSHDLSKIAFAAEDPSIGYLEIWLINADGTAPRPLTSTPKASTGPTWSVFPRFSPDDGKILFASTKSGSSQIWIMNVDGSNQQQLTNGLGQDYPDANAPNWSANGDQIVFWAGFETQYGEIWVMKADGTNPKQLTDETGTISSDNPAWSPDSGKIIFDTTRSGRGRIGVAIWIMNADGSSPTELIVTGSPVPQMSWRP